MHSVPDATLEAQPPDVQSSSKSATHQSRILKAPSPASNVDAKSLANEMQQVEELDHKEANEQPNQK